MDYWKMTTHSRTSKIGDVESDGLDYCEQENMRSHLLLPSESRGYTNDITLLREVDLSSAEGNAISKVCLFSYSVPGRHSREIIIPKKHLTSEYVYAIVMPQIHPQSIGFVKDEVMDIQPSEVVMVLTRVDGEECLQVSIKMANAGKKANDSFGKISKSYDLLQGYIVLFATTCPSTSSFVNVAKKKVVEDLALEFADLLTITSSSKIMSWDMMEQCVHAPWFNKNVLTEYLSIRANDSRAEEVLIFEMCLSVDASRNARVNLLSLTDDSSFWDPDKTDFVALKLANDNSELDISYEEDFISDSLYNDGFFEYESFAVGNSWKSQKGGKDTRYDHLLENFGVQSRL